MENGCERNGGEKIEVTDEKTTDHETSRLLCNLVALKLHGIMTQKMLSSSSRGKALIHRGSRSEKMHKEKHGYGRR